MQSYLRPGDSWIAIIRCDVRVRNRVHGIETPFPNIDLELLMPDRKKYELFLRSIMAEFPATVSHLQHLCKDAGRVLLSFLERPELSLFATCGLNYESLDAFAEHFKCGGFLNEFEDAVLKEHTLGLLLALRRCSEALAGSSWLDKPARELGCAVDGLLGDIKAYLNALYLVPEHRPSTNGDRDRRIWELKQAHPDWSWGKLAMKFGISDGAFQLAFQRQARRARRRLEELHRTAIWFQILGSPEIWVILNATAEIVVGHRRQHAHQLGKYFRANVSFANFARFFSAEIRAGFEESLLKDCRDGKTLNILWKCADSIFQPICTVVFMCGPEPMIACGPFGFWSKLLTLPPRKTAPSA